MKTIKFQDSSNQEICVQFSGGGDIRVYINEIDDPTKTKACMLLNDYQANILVNAIQELVHFHDE